MIINMIAAMAANRVIGNKNALPWDYPQDLKHFRNVTSGHVVVMGRNTYESIGRPLPNRRNIILTRTQIGGVECFSDIDTMIKKLESDPDGSGAGSVKEIFIIGGMSIYNTFLPMADYIYLTEIKKEYDGDTFFPDFEAGFEEVERRQDESGKMDFVIYKKK